MGYCVYIIYSASINRYYVGETEDFVERLKLHKTRLFKGSYTAQANDWQEFLVIPCSDRTIARKLESFIKGMKSRKFIEKMKASPEVVENILKRL